MSERSKISGFIPIFETKLARMKDKLKAEFEKSKSDRCRKTIKSLTKDCKDLKKLVSANKERCPHCGGEL